MINSAAGGVLILMINWLGAGLGVFVPLNLITALTVGILGVPGLVMLLVFFV
jgi:inhibitor of the pro-sigma K processing machinery